MSFFEENNENGTFSFGTELAPIPDKTNVLAVCEEALNKEYQDTRYIEAKWRVIKPAEYANRLIFQKLKVYESDKAATHRRMLAAIATNAGGKLFLAMQASGEAEPSDQSLALLTGYPMVLALSVWENQEKTKSGNWVRAISPAKPSDAQKQETQAPQAPPKKKPESVTFDEDEYDVPF